MDPPTAYVFPESYDRITVIKGPQTVLYGPGNSAGTVLFERTIKRLDRPEQNRFDANKCNIVGHDIGRTGGFGVLSLNGAYRVKKGAQITAGIDNLFDKSYAEHISCGGSAVTGFTTTTRVNEMGRNLWIKMNIAFD